MVRALEDVFSIDSNRATSCDIAGKKMKKMGDSAFPGGPVDLVNERRECL